MKRLSLLLLLFLASLVTPVLAQPHGYVPNPNLTQRSFERLVADWAWTQWPWTADEAPYRAINAQVRAAHLDQKVKAGQDPVKLLAPYKQAVVEHAGDALVAYKWVVAMQSVTKYAKPQVASNLWWNSFPLLHHLQAPQHYTADEPWFTLANTGKLPKPPHSYWFDRIMFIAAVKNGVFRPDNVGPLSRLADRLTKRNPRDREVQLSQIFMLQNTSRNFKDNTWRLTALRKAQKLVQQNPKEHQLLLTLADAYRYVWQDWGQFQYSQLALQTYQKYLRIAPKDAKARTAYNHALKINDWSKQIAKKYPTEKLWMASLKKK